MSTSENNDQTEKERIISSPNISANSNDIYEPHNIMPTDKGGQSEIDKKPIPEKEIKFHAADISRPDGKDLLVNIKGAQMRKIEKAKQQKKHQQETEKRKKAEKRKHKHEAKAIKRNNRIKSVKNIAKIIWGLRFIFLAVIAIIAALIIIFKFVIPGVNNKITEVAEQHEKESAEKILREERTDMMKILEKVIGTKLTKEELRTVANEINPDASIYAYENEGEISMNGSTEHIKFRVQNNLLFDFSYTDHHNGVHYEIYKSGNKIHYINDSELYELDSLKDAFVKYLTNIASSEER